MFDYYNKIIGWYLTKHQITVSRWYETMRAKEYLAYFDERTVLIPKPKTTQAFLYCLHEIGHIVIGPSRYEYLQEYRAEKFAIREGLKWGADVTGYSIAAREYVMDILVEEWAKGRVKRISKEVQKWLDLDINNWNEIMTAHECKN